MSLKCSVLGHRFDETSVERERDEEGTEVVITITEVETCSRCGESRIVSENKEVTTMEVPGEEGDASAADAADAPADSADEAVESEAVPGETAADAGGDDAEILDSGRGGESAAGTAARSETAIPDAEDGTTGDDGVVADSGAAPADDGPADRDGASEAVDRPTPDHSGTDETDPGRSEDDAGSRPEESGTDSAPGDRDAGSWPEEPESDVERPAGAADWPDDTSEDAATVDVGGGSMEWPESGRDDDSTHSGGDVDINPVEGPTITVPEGMFKCSECGFTTEVEASSLRAGDFCPDCHRGTLVQDVDSSSSD